LLSVVIGICGIKDTRRVSTRIRVIDDNDHVGEVDRAVVVGVATTKRADAATGVGEDVRR
jgi:hypothetical protein